MHLVKPRINLIAVCLLLLNVKSMLLACFRQLFVVDMLDECISEAKLLVKNSLKHLNFLAKLLWFDESHPLQVMRGYSSQVLLRMTV